MQQRDAHSKLAVNATIIPTGHNKVSGPAHHRFNLLQVVHIPAALEHVQWQTIVTLEDILRPSHIRRNPFQRLLPRGSLLNPQVQQYAFGHQIAYGGRSPTNYIGNSRFVG